MITLPKPGDESYEESVKQAKVRRFRVVLASHAPVAHILNLPCIYLMRKPRWHRYPLVHERNVIPILKHETLHHVLYSIHEDYDKGLDNIFSDLRDLP